MARSSKRDFGQVLNLQTIDSCTFRAPSGHIGGVNRATRLFGGQIASQALQAAMRTAPLLTPLHIHVRFIRPGTLDAPIQYEIDKEQLSLNLRSIEVKQDDRIIATCRVVFGAGSINQIISDRGLSTKRELSEMPPNTLLNLEQLMERYTKSSSLDNSAKKTIIERLRSLMGIFELRPTDPDQFVLLRRTRPTVTFWGRWRQRSTNDTYLHSPLHIALLLSDYAIFWSVHIELLAGGRALHSAASLSHSVWVHCDDFDAYDWLLFRVECSALADDRGLVRGTMFTRAGLVVLTVVQECFMRAKI